MGNGIVENFNKTIKNLLKKVSAEKPKDWHRYLGPLMFTVRDTPQDSTGFTPFELLYGHKVRTPMTLLKRIWTDEDEDPEVKTLYRYVVDLRDRVEETCKMAKEELAKVQVRNQKYYNKRTCDRKLQVGDSVLLLLPTERNKLTLVWRGPYKVVGIVGDFDYRVEVSPDKVKTYHMNMLKWYCHRESPVEPTFNGSRTSSNSDDNSVINVNQDVDHQSVSVACVIEEDVLDEAMSGKDIEALPLYNVRQKETVDDVIVNPQLSTEQWN